MQVMKKGVFAVMLFLGSTFLVSNCGGSDDFYICPRKCPSTEPWTIDYLETPYPCYKTKDECIEAALQAGFTADRCVRCD